MGTAPLWGDRIATAVLPGARPPGADPRGIRPAGPDVPEVRAVEHLGDDAVRVWHALEGGHRRRVDDLVVTVGVGHRAVSTALAMLELEGVVQRDGERWRRGVPGRRR